MNNEWLRRLFLTAPARIKHGTDLLLGRSVSLGNLSKDLGLGRCSILFAISNLLCFSGAALRRFEAQAANSYQKNRSGRLRGNYFFLLKMRECLISRPARITRSRPSASADCRRHEAKILASHIDVSPCAPQIERVGSEAQKSLRSASSRMVTNTMEDHRRRRSAARFFSPARPAARKSCRSSAEAGL